MTRELMSVLKILCNRRSAAYLPVIIFFAGCAGAVVQYSGNSAEVLMCQKCGACHRVYAPREVSSEKWKEQLPEMKKRAKLNDEQFALIKTYIDSVNTAAMHEVLK